MKVWDYVFTGIIIVLIVVLVVVAKNKPTEGFTELYFEDHTNLPKYTNGNMEFKFAIHNLENKPYTYNVEVSVEKDGKEREVVNNAEYTLEDNEVRTVKTLLRIEDFNKAKVIIALKGKDQSIHFWTKHAEQTIIYDGLGIGVTDCLNTVTVSPGEGIVIKARGSYADGWPEIGVYVDGKNVFNYTLNSNTFIDIPVYYEFNEGVHVVDIVFLNDYYDQKTKSDRNLYVDHVLIGNKYLGKEGMVIERGTGNGIVDCEDTLTGGDLLWDGALRFKVEVI